MLQGRYGSAAMDEAHLVNAARCGALNPVRARLVADARDWPHSSVAAHLVGRDDGLVATRPILERVANFADLLATAADNPAFAPLRRSERIGRRLAPGKRGRKPKGGATASGDKGK